MTVRELIAVLSSYDPDLPVVIDQEQTMTINVVETTALGHKVVFIEEALPFSQTV